MSDESVLKAEVKKNGEGGLRVAMGIIAAGVILLVANLLQISLMDYLWPIFLIGLGTLMIWPAYRSTREEKSRLSFFAVPGAMTVTLGGLLFLMNLVNHFESMAYSWTLILAAGAAGYAYMHRFDEPNETADKAHRFIRVMVIAFMALAIILELLVFQSLGAWWPILIIGMGIYLYIRNKRNMDK